MLRSSQSQRFGHPSTSSSRSDSPFPDYPVTSSKNSVPPWSPPSRSGSPSKMSRSYDPELPGSPTSASRLARRWFARRSRWLLGATLGGGCVMYFLDATPHFGHWRRPHGYGRHGPPDRHGGKMQDIWDEGGFHGGVIDDTESTSSSQNAAAAFVVDQYGDHFYHSYPDPRIPSFDPDISLLPLPNSLFAEISLASHLQPPKETPFPEESYIEIVSEEGPAGVEWANHFDIPVTAFAATWKPNPSPEWDGRRNKLPQVQWEGFKKGKYESKAEKKERLERKDAVRRGFVHAWQAYKDHAWGYDEIKPATLRPSDPFNNWGASIIDTLDTLIVLDLPDEYTLCRPHINQVNFKWINGRDWSRGYKTPPPESQRLLLNEDGVAADFSMPRDTSTNFGVFETGIRYLGGLVSAYDLTGDSIVLERAIELADMLGNAFRTESGLPIGHMDPGFQNYFRLHTVSIAEVGSMTIELTRLSQITGTRKYYDLAQRAIDFIEEDLIPRSVFEPLLPHWVTPGHKGRLDGTFSWGGLADSYYEYLIKQYKLLGGSSAAEQYKRIYLDSLATAKDVLFQNVTIIPGRDLLVIGKYENNQRPEVEHLTCFAGGMMGLASRLLNRPEDMFDAERFTKTCYWISAATETGLQPEAMEFIGEDYAGYENVTAAGLPHHPWHESVNVDEQVLDQRVHADRNGVYRWSGDGRPVYPEDGGRSVSEPVEYFQRLKGAPPGSKRVSVRGINRPETIESIFYMYRLTGDRKWQNRGWKMFTSWAEIAKTDGGMSSLYDVTVKDYHWSDNMESFTFAETFKWVAFMRKKETDRRYHYLLQCEPDHFSLDDYVFTTEAHPMLSNPKIPSGSQKFWKAPKSQHLGIQGRGTTAQMWTRLHHLKEKAKTYRVTPAADRDAVPLNDARQGGGKGMGGGGGDPNYKPRPPAEFDPWSKPKVPPPMPPSQPGEAEDED